MSLIHTDDQTMLKDSAAAFVGEAGPPAHLRSLRDTGDETGYSSDLWKQFANMGFTGILVPEAFGGLGLGQVEAGIVLEEIGRNLTPSPFLTTGVGAVACLSAAGGAVADTWLPRIAAGQVVAALAIDEDGRHRPAYSRLCAAHTESGYRLAGAKSFVLHGHVADLLLVLARTAGRAGEAEGLTLFAVDGNAAGLVASPHRLVDASIASDLLFDDVAAEVVGVANGGWAALAPLLGATRLGTAAELIGIGQAALDMTVGYLKQRKQFGRLIGEFQALQHRVAHLYAELEIARAAVLKAQQLSDRGDVGTKLAVSVAKAKAGAVANLAVREGVQMHGGIGMTDELNIGLYMKRERALSEFMGNMFYHADIVARLLHY